MKPKKIIIVRHGESEANINKELYGYRQDHLMQLTDKGKEQCITRGKSFKKILDGKRIMVWSSPYTRCRQTTENILSQIENAKIKYKEDPRLREQEWGNFYSVDKAKRNAEERKRHSYFFYRIKDGESGADVYDRISTFLESLHRDFKKDKKTDVVLISTHGITSLIFLMRFFHWKYEDYENAQYFNNCDYVILELDKETGRYKIGEDHRTGKYKNEIK